MTTQDKPQEKLDKVIYSYTAENNQAEEENQMLRDTVTRLDQELRRIKSPALMVCEVITILSQAEALIRIPNCNKFLCYVASDCDYHAYGDQVLVEQKNLNVIKK